MDTYKNTPKVKLLEFLAGALDTDELTALDQIELASVYCERLAANAYSYVGSSPNPPLQTMWRR
jgi:hypothetical protein